MKTWQKVKDKDFGKSLFIWRHRAISRFFTKIFTWLLGGFVSGILTSIFFLAVGLPDVSLTAARIVFFAVFLIGVISAFFRNVYNGLEYRITENALVHVKPMCGIESIGRILGSAEKPFGQQFEYISWERAKEIKDENDTFMMILKDREEAAVIGVAPVASYCNVGENAAPVYFPKLFASDEKANKTVLKQIVQKARDVRKTKAE
ncbi:hypothetical protein JXQ31_01810 [candidate division KSB1 bacterium]|nr:hypothetical protein [candidate division KSB1 bacterium]